MSRKHESGGRLAPRVPDPLRVAVAVEAGQTRHRPPLPWMAAATALAAAAAAGAGARRARRRR